MNRTQGMKTNNELIEELFDRLTMDQKIESLEWILDHELEMITK